MAREWLFLCMGTNNAEKEGTSGIVVTYRRFNLCINNESMSIVFVTTFLGVFIEDDLKWKYYK